MQRNPNLLHHRKFDLVIIGGGITGACVARDAILRGLSVALIEQRDFGGATSAASSRILHSGIRYLQQLRLGKARESAMERGAFMRTAPHLTRRIPFLIPAYRGWSKGQWLLRAGTTVHALAVKEVDAAEFISPEECLRRVPSLDRTGLTGGCVIPECQMISSERITLAVVLSAAAGGAVVVNYMPAIRLTGNGSRVTGVVVRDELTGADMTVETRVVLQALGPWPGLSFSQNVQPLGPRARWNAKGVHLITRGLTSGYAVALGSSRESRRVIGRGGRHIFVQPWRGHSLIGTTNDPYNGTPDAVAPSADDVASLLADVNAALPGAHLCASDVRHAYAGLFPVTVDPSRPEVYQVTGNYEVIDHASRDGVDGLVSVLSMKFTTARMLAEQATDLVMNKLRKAPVGCRTHEVPVLGGNIPDLDVLTASYRIAYPELDDETVRHLTGQYGSALPAVLSALRPLASRRLQATRPISEAEVHYAVTAESAVHLEDVVFRRTALADLGAPAAECLYRAASIMASYLGWSAAQIDAEVERTQQRFPLTRSIALAKQ